MVNVFIKCIKEKNISMKGGRVYDTIYRLQYFNGTG